MLRLERRTGENPIHVVLRERERLLTPRLIRAFLLAIAIHLFWLFLFQVQPFQMNKTSSSFPPVQVRVDKILSKETNSALFADIPEDSIERKKLPQPVWLKPEKPPLVKSSFPLMHRITAYPSADPFPQDPFIAAVDRLRLKEEAFWERSKRRHDLQTHSQVKGRIHITGHLAKRTILEEGVAAMTSLFLKEIEEERRLCFRITVENQSGEVIYYALESASMESLSKESLSTDNIRFLKKKGIAEQIDEIFRSLRFEPISEGFVMEGWVEFLFGESHS